jgi:hypothetical protein
MCNSVSRVLDIRLYTSGVVACTLPVAAGGGHSCFRFQCRGVWQAGSASYVSARNPRPHMYFMLQVVHSLQEDALVHRCRWIGGTVPVCQPVRVRLGPTCSS